MTIRIVAADDADLVIEGVKSVLNADHRFMLVGTARCMDDLLALIESVSPDVVVLGEWIYNLDILSAVEVIQRVCSKTKIIVMGGLADGLLIRDLFRVGVSAYLYKSDDLCGLLGSAIDTVLQDRPYLSPTANAEYLVAMQSPLRDWQLDTEARAMLRLLMQGLHIADIARRMDIPMRRAYFLRSKLKQRFGATTNEHLISRAMAEGFATTDA